MPAMQTWKTGFVFFPWKEKKRLKHRNNNKTKHHICEFYKKTLAEEITVRVHSREDYEQALKSSEILFGKATKEQLEQLTDAQLLDIFDGVPAFNIANDKLSGVSILDILAQETTILPSKGEAKKLVSANGIVMINLEKFADINGVLTSENLINGKYLVVKR